MMAGCDDRPRYTAQAIKATGLVEESKALLRAWQPGETSIELRRRARDNSLLGKATAKRSDDVVSHAFNRRFLSGPNPAAPHLRKLLARRGSGRWFTDLCLLYQFGLRFLGFYPEDPNYRSTILGDAP